MTEKIIPCPICKGSDKHEQRECTDYHHNDYDVWDESCGNCDGTGRMVEQTTIRKLNKNELTLRKRYSDEDIANDMTCAAISSSLSFNPVDVRRKVMEIFWNGKNPSVNVRNHRMVNAIKTLREMTGIGLSECKNMIDKWKDEDEDTANIIG